MKKLIASLAAAATVLVVLVGPVAADPINSGTVPLAATCSGLGAVTLYQEGPAHTNAFHVGGSTAMVLLPANGAPGLWDQAVAAGTTCSIQGLGSGPVIIVP